MTQLVPIVDNHFLVVGAIITALSPDSAHEPKLLHVRQAVDERRVFLGVTADAYPHAACAVRDGGEEVEEGHLEE